MLHTRLAALAAGVALAAAVVVGVCMVLPAQEAGGPGEYGYVYSGARSSSPAFVKATSDADTFVMFGSSEFSTPRRLVPQVPAATFGDTDYGLHLQLVGEAYDQSLWHAMALGAYAGADALPGGKCAIIVAPGWFADGGLDGSTFQTRFDYSLWRGFCENPDVPQAAKDYVATRLAELGVDGVIIDAPSGGNLQDTLNDLALSAMDDLSLRADLVGVRDQGQPLVRSQEPATPDWDVLRAEGLAAAQAMADNNEWGAENAFWSDQLAPVLDDLAGSRAGETYSDTPEYDDLDCFLSVAEGCGIEPLVIISPVMGPYYDHIGIDEATRSACYDRIRAVAAAHDCQVADFSDREYEKYFLFDIVHFGWTGWIDVEQAVYEFAKGE